MQKTFYRNYYNERIRNHVMFWVYLIFIPIGVFCGGFITLGQLFLSLSNSYSANVALLMFLLICCIVLSLIFFAIAFFAYSFNKSVNQYSGKLNQEIKTINFLVKEKSIVFSKARYDIFNKKESATYYIHSEDNQKYDVSAEMYDNIAEGAKVEVNYYLQSNFVISLKIH